MVQQNHEQNKVSKHENPRARLSLIDDDKRRHSEHSGDPMDYPEFGADEAALGPKQRLLRDHQQQQPNKRAVDRKDIAGDQERQHRIGRTPSGEFFAMPRTEGFWMGLFEICGVLLMIVAYKLTEWFWQNVGGVSRETLRWVFLGMFLLWRIAYNVGLGGILMAQSETEWFTRLYCRMESNYGCMGRVERGRNQAEPRSRSKVIAMLWKGLKRVAMRRMPGRAQGAPKEYNAWLMFRLVVDVILPGDVFSFIVFAWEFRRMAEVWDWSRIMGIVLGVTLMLVNLIVKWDAVRVVGEYAWYWGDFFFGLASGGELRFDGVFEIVPHPMYTLGYVWVYGTALVVGSIEVFLVGLLAHAMQLLFLVVVESPHIDKIYGNDSAGERKKDKASHRVEEEEGGEGGILSFDMILLVMSGYVLVMNLRSSSFLLAVQFVVARLAHLMVMFMLRGESKHQLISRCFGAKRAFADWKNLYRFTLRMDHLLFLLTVAKDVWEAGQEHYRGQEGAGDFSSAMTTRTCLGIVLMGIHAWTSLSVKKALGSYGWYYGDFFTADNGGALRSKEKRLRTNGIYRYLNNPERILGQCMWMGGAVMGGQKVWMMAIMGIISNWIVLERVERPHMVVVYGRAAVERQAGVTRGLQKVVGIIG